MERATFAAGCFWGVEATFSRLDGVEKTTVGYTGGNLTSPSYEQVCTDRTGHAEAIEVEFDPQRITYEQLLDVFFDSHDPTTPNRQGPDVGSQYRSAIFYHDVHQRAAAVAAIERLDASGKFARPIVTQVVSAAPFYAAEEYHQQYLAKRGIDHCGI